LRSRQHVPAAAAGRRDIFVASAVEILAPQTSQHIVGAQAKAAAVSAMELESGEVLRQKQNWREIYEERGRG
jgi:hypothetical protein